MSNKKKSHEKQDRLIEQLRENQDRIVHAIEHDPRKALTYEGDELPELDSDEDEEEDEPKITEIEEDDQDEEKQSTSTKKKSKFIDIDKGMNDEYKNY